ALLGERLVDELQAAGELALGLRETVEAAPHRARQPAALGDRRPGLRRLAGDRLLRLEEAVQLLLDAEQQLFLAQILVAVALLLERLLGPLELLARALLLALRRLGIALLERLGGALCRRGGLLQGLGGLAVLTFLDELGESDHVLLEPLLL